MVPAGQKLSAGNLLVTDPPRHHTLRRLVGAAFSPKVVNGVAARIAEITHELLDATGGAGQFDLVDTLAYPLPVIVISELLGLPAGDRELFRTWADKLLNLDVADPDDPQLASKLDEATAELLAYLQEHCTDRRAQPGEDLISRLATVEADGQRLTDEEVVNADRSLVEATIEEVLRYRTPFIQVARVAMADTELAGQVIPADALVTPWLLSANRDERKFPDPDRFDIHRSRHHMAFGYGIHFCIGQLLARVETRVAMGVLLDRYAQIRLTPGVPLEFYGQVVFTARNLPVTVRS